jgi:uncharacterized damage-inducible protein DinB
VLTVREAADRLAFPLIMGGQAFPARHLVRSSTIWLQCTILRGSGDMTKRIVLIQALASTPADFNRMTKSVTQETAVWREREETWSLADIAAHLTLVERACLDRLRRVLDEDEPHVPPIHPDPERHELHRPVADLTAEFSAARVETLRFLESLAPGAWQRAAHLEFKGRMTLRYLVQDMVGHDIEHTNQAVEVLQRARAAVTMSARAA